MDGTRTVVGREFILLKDYLIYYMILVIIALT